MDSVGVTENIRMQQATEVAAQPVYEDEGDSVSTIIFALGALGTNICENNESSVPFNS